MQDNFGSRRRALSVIHQYRTSFSNGVSGISIRYISNSSSYLHVDRIGTSHSAFIAVHMRRALHGYFGQVRLSHFFLSLYTDVLFCARLWRKAYATRDEQQGE